ncbi:hypothetical protein J1N35_005797 [Gossypium stocksii]|uniref:Uncharacterized protein n=1 Tax=Gossypium stocksii TaxID=47602 RepID=A0A9D3WEK5_9ROSI|nr:hypothetical protein J1N35_005797 [Gossypium stocksii]
MLGMRPLRLIIHSGDNFCIVSIPLSGLVNLTVNQLFSIDEMTWNVDFMEGILTPIDVNLQVFTSSRISLFGIIGHGHVFGVVRFHQRLKTLFGDVFEVFCQQKLTWLREVSMWLSRVLDVERSRISIVFIVCPIAVTVLQLARLQPGFLKCNVDEAWFEDDVTTNYAALPRDSHGHVKCFIGIARSVMDPSIGKAFVVREAFSWLRSFNVGGILMELDSSPVPKQDLFLIFS